MALQKLGPFELLRVLGRGGMGTVYEAVEVASKKKVALKVLAPAYSFDEHFRNRFEGEIDALMQLDHPNIVRLLSYGQDEGSLFFAMELISGTTLFHEQKNGHVFHWREIIDIAIQVCSGLRHAHDRGIIHRDLKPGNLMLSGAWIKITDFGIAKSFGKSALTGTGNVLGTMDFMAPEQARGKPASVRSDIFSLGAVMYSLIAGRPPFLRETAEQTFEALLSQRPPDRLTKLAADVPAPLALLIHRLLEKDPMARIGTAQATERQLIHVRDEISSAPSPDTQVVSSADEQNVNHLVYGDSPSRTFLAPSGERSGRDAVANPPVESANKMGEKRASPAQLNGVEPTISPSQVPSSQALPPRQSDYYSEITPQIRAQRTQEAEDELPRGRIWPIALALAFVIGLAGLGIWYTLIRVPSADELLAVIERHENAPSRASEEIKLFIKYYSDHDQSAYVAKQQKYAVAERFYRGLRLRKRLNESISSVEQEFVEIVELISQDAPLALAELSGFIVSHEKNEESLSINDRLTVGMARTYELRVKEEVDRLNAKIRSDIETALQNGRQEMNSEAAIRIFNRVVSRYGDLASFAVLIEETKQELAKRLDSELKRAENHPDKSEARKIYRFIIELFDKQEWAADFNERARQALLKIDG